MLLKLSHTTNDYVGELDSRFVLYLMMSCHYTLCHCVQTRAGYVLVYQRRKPDYRRNQQDDDIDDKLQLTSHTATATASIGSPERNMGVNSDNSSDNGMDTN